MKRTIEKPTGEVAWFFGVDSYDDDEKPALHSILIKRRGPKAVVLAEGRRVVGYVRCFTHDQIDLTHEAALTRYLTRAREDHERLVKEAEQIARAIMRACKDIALAEKALAARALVVKHAGETIRVTP